MTEIFRKVHDLLLNPNAVYRIISKDQESEAFAILEAEFARGRGERTANIVLDGKVIVLAFFVQLYLVCFVCSCRFLICPHR